MTAPALICATVEVALNRTLRLEPEVLADFARLRGKLLGLRVDGLEWSFFIECLADGVRVAPEAERAADVQLGGGAIALSRLLAQVAGGATTLPPGVELQGDAELLHRFTGLLARIGFDPAEVVARYLGDGAAQRLVGGLRGLLGWGRRSADTLSLDTAEYLREESRDLARRIDAEEWMDAVDVLREGTDRLEARLRRLEGAGTASP
ncbi:MAG: SCP2 sterol-binding domain-containing protein [Stagnimonas sp.]|nr:SCP2 sterol-binding domain-containing protein [Stagnimonas sp.]